MRGEGVECDLVGWREHMKLTRAQACRELGCSRVAYGKWEAAGRAPRFIALAARALANGMKGWEPKDG